jgi:DNA-binding NarL/FixJ family response regulator
MINLLIADDHAVVRQGLKLLLSSQSMFNVAGEGNSGLEILDLLGKGAEVDIVLTDYMMPDMDGNELTMEVVKNYPHIKIIILSMIEDKSIIAQLFRNGASGFLSKDIKPMELVFSIKHVYSGEKYISASFAHELLKQSISQLSAPVPEAAFSLNSRESEILNLISEGLSNQEMSDKLFLSKRTVEGHRMSLLSKMGSKNTAALVRSAMLYGLLS